MNAEARTITEVSPFLIQFEVLPEHCSKRAATRCVGPLPFIIEQSPSQSEAVWRNPPGFVQAGRQ